MNDNVLPFPKKKQMHNDDPFFAAFRYPDGSITVHVEGFAKDVDGWTLFTFTPHMGIEPGASSLFVTTGQSEMLVFTGSYAEQRAIFDEWSALTKTNNRPALYREKGLLALAKLKRLPEPPLPKIDEEATASANESMSRLCVEIDEAIAEGRELTLADCVEMAEAAS